MELIFFFSCRNHERIAKDFCNHLGKTKSEETGVRKGRSEKRQESYTMQQMDSLRLMGQPSFYMQLRDPSLSIGQISLVRPLRYSP
jgi:hypothetical protein